MTEAELAAASLAAFESHSSDERIDPDYVLAADIPLELSGEAVRSRLCLFTDYRGNEMAMRPDLTLPVACREVERQLGGNQSFRTYTYAARAFRLPATSEDPLEFTQAGFEMFGHGRWPVDDVHACMWVIEALAACDVTPTAVVTGDLAIFPAVVDALGLPLVTAGLLKRAFRQEGGVAELLAAKAAPLDPDMTAVLEADDPVSALRACLGARDIAMIGTRSEAEIIEGLRSRAEVATAGGVPAEARRVLEDFSQINCPLAEAADRIAAFASAHGLAGLDDPIGDLAVRSGLLIERKLVRQELTTFRSGFGRRFTYYDGFLFEIFGENLTMRQPVASGGRYDGLISALSGGKVSATGIGGVVRPARVLRAKGVAA